MRSARRSGIQRLLSLAALVSLFLSVLILPVSGRGLAQTTPEDQAQALLQQLTPQERVGQLFLVTFQGDKVEADSQIADLIVNRHIGGVILLAANGNLTGGPEAAKSALTLTRQIQTSRWNASRQNRIDPVSGANYTPAFIPLFVGLSQEGDGYPYDQILSGMSPLPNQMALGATWNPDLAAQVGSVLGSELSALGFNFLLGPSLDVLDTPHPDGSRDLGTRTFGGDPFWVAKLGKAYIRGVHAGSNGRVAVVARHFPGYGGSDRLPEEEVATVRKSLEQLQDFELAPFFAVTGAATQPDEATDGLLAAHIRYQGFQGNIRATTRPVSFDPQAFNLLLSLPQIDAWRQNGGLMVSDDLGSRAVRRFYDLTSQTFDARRVALNAFLAGNDLLYVADFSSTLDADSYVNAVRTLDFFTQKYREDPAFAQRVDESVRRILTLKYRLYGSFGLDGVLPSFAELTEVGTSQVTFEVARQAATLISPSQAELDDEIPEPPDLQDRIVILSDTRIVQPCPDCINQPLIEQHALETLILRRYGPQAGGSVSPSHIRSFSLTDLATMLAQPYEPSELADALNRANWIVFAMLNSRSDLPSFPTLAQFLSERPDLFQQKRLVVFAFNAPFFLDATDISKLTAYYGLYSKTPQFLDVAVYLLFRELRPTGALPVSVSGISYDLNTALFPNPNQVIPLMIDGANEPMTTPLTVTVTPPPPYEFKIGDQLPLRTGVILDHNGRPVPDGTPVEFILSNAGEVRTRQTVNTRDGLARTIFAISEAGMLEIHAESELARSASLRFEIPAPIDLDNPATSTPQPSPTLEPTATATLPPVDAAPVTPIVPPRPQLTDWLVALFIIGGIAWSAYSLIALVGQMRWGVRAGLLAAIGGLLAYIYLALQLPGSERLLASSVSRSVFLSTLSGAAVGLFAAWMWRQLDLWQLKRQGISDHLT
jgi:beta-N-acetylhexosaminidase